jgi:gluconate 2-dehydrogenase alpha chain
LARGIGNSIRRLPEVDVVVVGVGWAGGIICAELSKAGLQVVGLERGPLREASDSEYLDKHDELRFRVRQDMLQNAAQETWTFRHHHREAAMPIRYLGAFCPASGVGGSSAHYGGLTTRFAPWEFEMRSRTTERYGEAALPEGSTIQDWGVTFDDLEPYYDVFERAVGVSGKAGNLRGAMLPGGNPFEGERSREFPLPPLKVPAAPALFRETAEALGHHPYSAPSAILSRDYTNPDGISRPACAYCGDCSWYLCAVDAKGDSRVAVLPAALERTNFDLRPESYVVEVVHEGGRARGVRYYDASGKMLEQPARIVVLSAYALNNVRLLLLSGLGEPYDPQTQSGLVGKNYAYQISQPSFGFFKGRKFKNFIASAGGVLLDDFANDNFDHSELGFIGGAHLISTVSHSIVRGPPLPSGSPRWGRGWQKAMADWYDRAALALIVGHSLSYRTNHLDLDPTYKDAWDMPLLRITFDWHANEHRIFDHSAAAAEEIWRAAGADEVATVPLARNFDAVNYQSTHNTGGAIMGTDPGNSVVDAYLRMWDSENVWVVGGSAFPQNGTPGPTGTIAALAYRASENILEYAR